MYVPSKFAEPSVERVLEIVRGHPFASLVTVGSEGPDAEHIPMLHVAEPGPLGVLRGHVARANPVWREVQEGASALAIFRGPDVYVSPSYYPSKREHGEVVPTWNYALVHAHGTLRFVHDRAWLRALVAELTDVHERGREVPWSIDDAPAEFIERLLGAIVGVELTITRIVGKVKASQNRSPADREGVVAGLSREGGDAASAMAEMVRSR